LEVLLKVSGPTLGALGALAFSQVAESLAESLGFWFGFPDSMGFGLQDSAITEQELNTRSTLGALGA
jgi:lactam utilization protein B